MNSLNITAGTSLQNLQTFMEGKGENTRIYGKKEKDKTVTLYTKPESSSAVGRLFQRMGGGFANLFGVGAQRRTAALKGLQQILDRVIEKTEDAAVIDLFKDIKKNALGGFKHDSDLANRTGDMSRIMKMVAAVVKQTAEPSVIRNPTEVGERDLESVGLGKDKAVGFLPGEKVKGTNTEVGPIKLGDKVYKPLREIGTGGFGDVYLMESVPQKEGEEKTTIAFKVSIPGRDPNATGQKMSSAAHEIKMHRELSQSSPNSVIGFIDAVRLENGQVGIATELAPHGDMQQMSNKILGRIAKDENNLQPGELTRREAKVLILTMVRDMAEGLAGIHEKSNATHYDFKNPNMLINNEGKAVVSDFGTTFLGSEISYNKTELIGSAAYKAPEICYASVLTEQKKKHITSMVEMMVKHEKDMLRGGLTELFNSDKTTEVQKIINDKVDGIYSDRAPKIRAKLENTTDEYTAEVVMTNTQKVDIWGLGSSIIELMRGIPLMGMEPEPNFSKFEFKKENRLVAFMKDGYESAIQPRQLNGYLDGKSISGGTGDDRIDSMLNWILAPKPEDRPTARQIMNHPIFTTTPGVGSTQAYDMIRFLSEKGDEPQSIENARLQLSKKMNLN